MTTLLMAIVFSKKTRGIVKQNKKYKKSQARISVKRELGRCVWVSRPSWVRFHLLCRRDWAVWGQPCMAWDATGGAQHIWIRGCRGHLWVPLMCEQCDLKEFMWPLRASVSSFHRRAQWYVSCLYCHSVIRNKGAKRWKAFRSQCRAVVVHEGHGVWLVGHRIWAWH